MATTLGVVSFTIGSSITSGNVLVNRFTNDLPPSAVRQVASGGHGGTRPRVGAPATTDDPAAGRAHGPLAGRGVVCPARASGVSGDAGASPGCGRGTGLPDRSDRARPARRRDAERRDGRGQPRRPLS